MQIPPFTTLFVALHKSSPRQKKIDDLPLSAVPGQSTTGSPCQGHRNHHHTLLPPLPSHISLTLMAMWTTFHCTYHLAHHHHAHVALAWQPLWMKSTFPPVVSHICNTTQISGRCRWSISVHPAIESIINVRSKLYSTGCAQQISNSTSRELALVSITKRQPVVSDQQPTSFFHSLPTKWGEGGTNLRGCWLGGISRENRANTLHMERNQIP